MKKWQSLGWLFALLAALFYGFSAPFSKALLTSIDPILLAGLLYLGAGIGILIVSLVIHRGRLTFDFKAHERLSLFGMVILDIIAPVLFFLGLNWTTAAATSLLNNAEVVMTAFIALMLFHEKIKWNVWLAIGLILIAGVVLSFEDMGAFRFSPGALLVVASTIGWGFENNLTRKLSNHDPMNLVIIKGFGSGLGSLILAASLGTNIVSYHPSWPFALILGLLAYGLSIYCYILAQRFLGAARTSAFFASAPFIGVLFAILWLGEPLTYQVGVAVLLMAVATYFLIDPFASKKTVKR